MTPARCPRCKNRIVQKSAAETKVFIQGPLIIGEDGVCRGECRSCRGAIEVPLELSKAYSEPSRERVIIIEHVAKPTPGGHDT